MRPRALLAVAAFVGFGFLPSGLRAQAPAPAAPAPPPAAAPPASAAPAPAAQPNAAAAATELARRHFKNGVRLYRDANYTAALAEFEAAYAAKPGPGSLQNIALCQKALFRYGEAADTLGKLLRRHDAELSEGERAAARQAKAELENLVGTLRVRVQPEHAAVTLDGAPLGAAERMTAVRVNVGEHTLAVEAPGYAPISKTVRVASGQKDVPVEISLEPVSAFLEVRASDPGAAIAVDGKALALGQWVGTVSAGEEHLVQVYRSGFQPFEQRVKLARGQMLVVVGKLGPPRPPGEETGGIPVTPGALPAPPVPPKPVGWYAQGTLTFYGTNAKPFDFDLSDATTAAGGIGARVGYRIWPTVAVDGFLELGQLAVKGACDENSPSVAESGRTCADSDAVIRDYEIGWFRLGPIFRLMNADDRLRIAGGIGAGIVAHRFHLGASKDGDFGEANTQGVDPYFLFEIGLSANWRHVIFGLDFVAILDGSRGLDAGDESAFEDSGRTLAFLGLGVRIGWSEWAPAR
jgi:hypothetical protein